MTPELPSARGPTAWLAARVRIDAPGTHSPSVSWFVRRVLGPGIRLAFRPALGGWERLPADRACLVVANHSGSGVADVLCLALAVLERPAGAPRITGMAHPIAFFVPIVGWVLRGLGAIPSTYAHAERALAAGVHVLVFPGGDHEAFRPIWQAGRVDFAGRQGFLRLARRARVPVLPLGYWGTHFTQPILWRSRLLPWLGVLPRCLGLKRLPVTLPWLAGVAALAVLLARAALSPWAAAGLFALWTSFPLIYFIPILPWPVRMRFGEPLEPGDLFGPGGDDGAPLDATYTRVVAAVQAALDAARAG